MALDSGYTNISELLKHPSVQWMKQRSQEGRDQLLRAFEGAPKTREEAYARMQQYKGQDMMENMPDKYDPEFARHMDVIKELAKSNPQVLYEAGIMNDGVYRPNPNAPQYEDKDLIQNLGQTSLYGQDTTNPQFQYRIGAPEPQQEPSFQRQQGAEQPGQVWQQGLQQAMQDGTLREYLDKTVYKRQTEEEKKKKEALTNQGEKAKGYTSTPYQMSFQPVSTLLR